MRQQWGPPVTAERSAKNGMDAVNSNTNGCKIISVFVKYVQFIYLDYFYYSEDKYDEQVIMGGEGVGPITWIICEMILP